MWAPEEGAVKTPLLKGGNINNKFTSDPSWRGVKQERVFRDVIFAVLFLLCFGAMIGIGILGFSKGDPSFLPNMSAETVIAEHVDSYMTTAVAQLKEGPEFTHFVDKNYLVASMFGAVVLAGLWIQGMKWFTKAFIYIMIALGLAAMVALGVYLFTVGSRSDTNSDFILIIVTFFLRKKIALTAALMKEACRGLQHNPSLFLVSGIVVVIFLAFAAFWVTQFVFLYSVPDDQQSTKIGDDSFISFSTSYRNLMWFQLFAGLWTTFTIGAIFQHSIAGGYASWYFSQNSPNKPSSPAFKALGWGLTKNFGSLAFGSLIVAILAFINFLLEKAKQSNQTNKVLQAILSCIQCCLGSVQSLVEWINKFAFIYIAMHGEGFCASAKGVFKLMSRNFFSAVVVDLISDFVLFFGKVLGSCAVTLLTVVAMDSLDHPVSLLTIVLIAVGTYLVFSLFGSIVGTGVDTVLICYLEDLERNRDGALNMNVELHNMLQERTDKLRAASPPV